ncbi:hypothetical protein [Thiocystis violascens]|uniref:hypothetical protein n=1 Tax=Thiocystis violascens TaxID=73141 RepID=UPI00022C4620|nr:hypothetical protein [Thiocystis violascens]
MAVTANITVSFGDQSASSASGHLSAEIDSRPDGLNNGVTSFAPGDSAAFLVYKSSNVTYDAPVASAGSVAGVGSGLTVEKEDDLSFADSDTASLSTPATGIVSVTWLGRSLGSLSLQDQTTVKAGAKGVAVARVKYACRADAYRLTSPATLAGLTDFSILVFILGHLAGEG